MKATLSMAGRFCDTPGSWGSPNVYIRKGCIKIYGSHFPDLDSGCKCTQPSGSRVKGHKSILGNSKRTVIVIPNALGDREHIYY